MKMSLSNFQVFGSKWGKNIDQIALLGLAKHFHSKTCSKKEAILAHILAQTLYHK